MGAGSRSASPNLSRRHVCSWTIKLARRRVSPELTYAIAFLSASCRPTSCKTFEIRAPRRRYRIARYCLRFSTAKNRWAICQCSKEPSPSFNAHRSLTCWRSFQPLYDGDLQPPRQPRIASMTAFSNGDWPPRTAVESRVGRDRIRHLVNGTYHGSIRRTRSGLSQDGATRLSGAEPNMSDLPDRGRRAHFPGRSRGHGILSWLPGRFAWH